MKKVVLASLLACAAVASGLPSASAQQPVALGSGGANQPIQMPDAELTPYNAAIAQKDPKLQAPLIEDYLAKFPQSQVKLVMLVQLMNDYSGFDPAKAITTADAVLQLDPNNFRALFFETFLRKQAADAMTDPSANAAKQAGLDAAAGFAQKGLAATKPADMDDATFKTLQATGIPYFYSAIAEDALNKNDNAGAIENYKKEIASVPLDQTKTPGPVLLDMYLMAVAYYQSKPPDLLNCAFYAARVVDYAPPALKPNFATLAKLCYKNFHGGDDGSDAISTSAQNNLNPPDGLFASIKPAPTPAEKIHAIIATTPDLATLATEDKELVFQYGSPEDAQKVWDTVKGKSYEFPNTLVIESSPAVLKVAVTDNAIQSKTADFTFNMTPIEDIPEPKATATPAQKAAYKKAKANADAVTAAMAVGSKVTLSGTYDSFTPNPLMITMKDGAVVLPKATPTKPPVAAHPRPAAKR